MESAMLISTSHSATNSLYELQGEILSLFGSVGFHTSWNLTLGTDSCLRILLCHPNICWQFGDPKEFYSTCHSRGRRCNFKVRKPYGISNKNCSVLCLDTFRCWLLYLTRCRPIPPCRTIKIPFPLQVSRITASTMMMILPPPQVLITSKACHLHITG